MAINAANASRLRRLALAVWMLVCLSAPAVACDPDITFGPVHPSQRIASTHGATEWFVEFRARGASVVGHTFVALGVRTAKGGERIVRYAGFYARGGALGAVSSIVGVPGVIGYKKSDLDKASLHFRHTTTRARFARVERLIGALAANPGFFTMLKSNCNAFVARIARSVGLKTPRHTAQYAPAYLRQMIALNRRR